MDSGGEELESATWMEIEGRVTLHQELAFLAEKDSASKSILRIIEMYGKKTFSDKFLTDYIAATRSTLLRSSCDIPVVVNPVVSRAVTPLVVAKQPQLDVQAPQWDDDGEVIPTSEPVAAVSVVENRRFPKVLIGYR